MQFCRQVFPNQVTVAASLYRYTLATPMPSTDVISEGLRPSFAIRVHFAMVKGKGHPIPCVYIHNQQHRSGFEQGVLKAV